MVPFPSSPRSPIRALILNSMHTHGVPAGARRVLGKETHMGHFRVLGASFKEERALWGRRQAGGEGCLGLSSGGDGVELGPEHATTYRAQRVLWTRNSQVRNTNGVCSGARAFRSCVRGTRRCGEGQSQHSALSLYVINSFDPHIRPRGRSYHGPLSRWAPRGRGAVSQHPSRKQAAKTGQLSSSVKGRVFKV